MIRENKKIIFFDIQLPYFQRKNLSCAFMAAILFCWKNKKTFKATFSMKILIEKPILGRWQQLSKDPDIIIDMGHNIGAINTIIEEVKLKIKTGRENSSFFWCV